MKRYAALVVAVATLPALSTYALELKDPFETVLGRRYRLELQALTPPQARLPTTCQLVRKVEAAPIFPATTNPFVTEDARLIQFVSLVGFGSERLDDVSVAFSALFHDTEPRHEVGVWGLGFESTEAAAKARSSLSARDVLLKGRMIVSLWHDDEVGRACRQAIEAHLIKNGFVRSGPTP